MFMDCKTRLIRSPVLGFQIGSSSSWSPSALVYGPGQVPSDSGGGYLSTVFNTAKQRAAALRWSPLDASQLRSPKVERQMSSPAPTDSVIATGGAVSTGPVGKADELSLSSQIEHEQLNLSNTASGSSRVHESLTSENFDKFRSDQEARLKQWLEETENHSRHSEAS